MQFSMTKTLAIVISLLMIISIAAPLTALAQVPVPAGSKVPTYAFLNVAPNPVGVGQIVTLNMFLLVPLLRL